MAFERSTHDALARADVPYLDVGCGALSQTAPAYARTARPLVLLNQWLCEAADVARGSPDPAGVASPLGLLRLRENRELAGPKQR